MGYPQYRDIAYLLFMGKDYTELYKFVKESKLYLDSLNEKDFIVLGPSAPYISRINNTYRLKLMVKYRNIKRSIEIFKALKEKNLKNNRVKIAVIVNPSNDI